MTRPLLPIPRLLGIPHIRPLLRATKRPFRRPSSTATATVRSSESDESALPVTPLPRINLPHGLKLRPYQLDCIQSCLAKLDEGVGRFGVSLPTGSGKTTVFCVLLSSILPPPERPEASRVLILVGSMELVDQAAAQVRFLCPTLSVEVEQGQKRKATGLADVTIATYQTLCKPERLEKFDPYYYKAVIVDEAHHSTAPSYLRILSHFNAAVKPPKTDKADTSSPTPSGSSKVSPTVPIVGLSATFERHDQTSLGKVYQEIVFHRSLADMISQEWLSKVVLTTVRAQIDLSQVAINHGDFTPSSLARVVNTPAVNKLVVRTWLDRARDRKSTLAFCVNKQHVHDLTAEFREAGVDARSVSSSTPIVERKELISAFKRGEFPVLVNCAILTEGADVPNIDCVLVARPTRSKTVFTQIVGRGMRLWPGKTDCRIIDFVDSMERVGDIVSWPSLFGFEEEEVERETIDDHSLDDESDSSDLFVEGSSRVGDEPGNIPEPTSVTYLDHNNPFSLDADTAGSAHIGSLSPYSWVQCGQDTWVLDCLGKGFIKIVTAKGDGKEKVRRPTIRESWYMLLLAPEPGLTSELKAKGEPYFEAFFTPENANKNEATDSPYYRKRRVLTARTLADAIKGCDMYASKTVLRRSPMLRGLLRGASWRKDPATDKQKGMLTKRLKITSDEVNSIFREDGSQCRFNLDIDKLTKGQAGNIIIKLKHGAQASYVTRVKKEAAAKARAEKDRLRREGHEVRIGPLV
ncbi:hypothetical protein FRB99_008141 [Tulasnella sp. 403]|nr:hypothetical protein FRB99_008141 [Tulasnella sp. 403]